MNFFVRLRERKLAQWTLAYLSGAWVLYQVATLVGQNFAWPPVWLRVLTVLLVVGFGVALVLAWYHGERGQQRASGPELLMVAALLVVAGVAVAAVRRDTTPAGPAAAAAPAVEPAVGAVGADTAVPARSIVVLPFANLSGDPDNTYFSDGITEDILTSLSRVAGLTVISRTSALQYRDTQKPVRQIGRELGVATVLEGSVRRDGDRVRITAQLIDARNDAHLWAERYDRELTDLFTIQAEIAEQIAAALRAELTAGDRTRLATAPTQDLEAYQLYLQARHLWFEHTEETHARAHALYRRALERDPSFALAYAGLSDLYADYSLTRDRDANVARARAAAGRALALDSSIASVHENLAFLLSWYDGDQESAERAFRRALALDPGYVTAHHDFAVFLSNLGRFEEAMVHHRRAMELDPVVSWPVAWLARTLRLAGRADEAIPLLLNVDLSSPRARSASRELAEAYLAVGRTREGVTAAEAAARVVPDALQLSTLAYAYARAGRAADARRVLRDLPTGGAERFEWPRTRIARVHMALGNPGAALDELERALRERDPSATEIAVEPAFIPLRGNARFRALLREAGLAG